MILCFDVGGTAIKYALVEGKGRIVSSSEVPTEGGGPGVVRILSSLSMEHAGEVRAIAVSTAGQVDSESGTIIFANEHIPGYTGTKLAEILHSQTGLPVSVENDVKSAAIGEGTFGAGKGRGNYLCLTYGTGVGGALVMDGRLVDGAHHAAGEFGHILLHENGRLCACGLRGCYEAYASTSALVSDALQVDPSLTDGRKIFARLEDPAVKAVVDAWLHEVALGLGTLVNILDPGTVIVGGGVMGQRYPIERLRRLVPQRVMAVRRDVEILPALLGNKAGLLGAYASALTRLS